MKTIIFAFNLNLFVTSYYSYNLFMDIDFLINEVFSSYKEDKL